MKYYNMNNNLDIEFPWLMKKKPFNILFNTSVISAACFSQQF